MGSYIKIVAKYILGEFKEKLVLEQKVQTITKAKRLPFKFVNCKEQNLKNIYIRNIVKSFFM